MLKGSIQEPMVIGRNCSPRGCFEASIQGLSWLKYTSGIEWTLASCRMHVHFIMDTSDEYKAKTGRSGWKSWKSQEVSTDVAFLKHIRPMTHIDETNKTVLFPCHFGNQSDPKGEHLRVTL